MTTVDLVSPYEVRDQFKPLHARDTRWFIGVAHRRAGKTVADINELVIGATKCRLPIRASPMSRRSSTRPRTSPGSYLKEYTTAFLKPKINESELWVELPGGARIRIYGADNPDRLRGIYLDGVVLDEFGDMDPTIWTQVIRPALSIARAGPASSARPRARTRSTRSGSKPRTIPRTGSG
jgi:phage terminase large subunit